MFAIRAMAVRSGRNKQTRKQTSKSELLDKMSRGMDAVISACSFAVCVGITEPVTSTRAITSSFECNH